MARPPRAPRLDRYRPKFSAGFEYKSHVMHGPTYSGLIAIALVIRSREGPRFVYHYPARPSIVEPDLSLPYGTELHTDNDDDKIDDTTLGGSSSASGDSEEDIEPEIGLSTRISAMDLNGGSKCKGKESDHVLFDDYEGEERFETLSGEHFVPWEHLFEFHTTDLESILTPTRAYNKKMFDLSLDPLHFLSYPIHIREDGTWKKKKPKKPKKVSKNSDTKNASDAATPVENVGSRDSDDDNDGGMTMFNVVFIMDVGKQGADIRVKEIYEHVAKKFNKALSHAQASSNYVWKESELILSMKEKAKEERRPICWLWNEISMKSTLACAVRDIYTAISTNRIANINLDTKPPLALSLQIPIPTFLTQLPSFDQPGLPGLLVTSANPVINEEGIEDPEFLNKHFALLLLEDEAKVIAEIQADNSELAAPLIECIRLCKPTLSFLQVAQANAIDCGSLLVLAQHLMHWRKAIAIPPLHARETYIVSPNCDSRRLVEASVAWKRAFPLAPTLPTFLAVLSAAPRPYKSFAPSKDHRPTYLEMLAWSIRGGWVTQLRTFAWILVWPEIKYEVDYQLKAQEQEKAMKKGASNGSSESNQSTDESSSERISNDASNLPLTTAQAAENARLERLAQKQAKESAEAVAAFAKMPKPVATAHPSCNDAAHLEGINPYIIKDPHKVEHEESLYIKAIGERFTDPKLKDCWGRFTKFFNGEEALEMISLRENMKRKETWNILLAFQEHLLVCKHW